MKAILIAFLLFASLFFLPTSTTARQLKEGSFQTGDPNKPAVNCPPGQSYRSCSPSPKPKPPCSPYKRRHQTNNVVEEEASDEQRSRRGGIRQATNGLNGDDEGYEKRDRCYEEEGTRSATQRRDPPWQHLSRDRHRDPLEEPPSISPPLQKSTVTATESKAVMVERAKREGSSYHKVKVRQPLEAKIHMFCVRAIVRRNARVLGDLLLCSGEDISPKRENEDVSLCFEVSRIGERIRVLGDKASRPGERRSVSSPRRGGTRLSETSQVNQFCPLAQARKLSLSETGLVHGWWITCDGMSGQVHTRLLSCGDTSEVRRVGLRVGRFVEAGPREGRDTPLPNSWRMAIFKKYEGSINPKEHPERRAKLESERLKQGIGEQGTSSLTQSRSKITGLGDCIAFKLCGMLMQLIQAALARLAEMQTQAREVRLSEVVMKLRVLSATFRPGEEFCGFDRTRVSPKRDVAIKLDVCLHYSSGETELGVWARDDLA
ncbi:hypothetical protein DEO72_LG10g2304 [Vigna unguiculata]|uniref:Uncharacterized protein n=1 Tax=Vigna unguiculata TaxID=3917 RepID=A0A4D6NDW4_VIGUN|nr:hypothetical protein DEO72_LG10g2304 [Vigna unguiculata]